MLGHRSLVLDDYVSIVKRRGWIILIPLLVLPVLTFAFSYTIKPEYLSQTSVLVEGQRVAEGIVKPVLSGDLDSRLASMKEQILSRSSIQPIIEKYNLYADQKLSMDDRVDMARKSINIKTITSETGRGGLPGFFISFKAGDPATAQQVCSQITSLFTSENLQARSDAAQGTVDFLKAQVNDAKNKMDEQDAKLAKFQQENFGRLPGEESNNSSMLTSLNSQLEASTQAITQLNQNKMLQESLLSQQLGAEKAAATTASMGVSSPVAGEGNPYQDQLAKLQADRATALTMYTPDHPDILALDRQIADVRKLATRYAAAARAAASGSSPSAPARVESSSIQQLRAQLQATTLGIEDRRRQQAQIQGQIASYQSRLMSSPAVEQQFKQLTRDHDQAQTFYNDLQGKLNSAQMATNLENRQQGEQFRLLDAANLPEAPFSPKRGVFLIAGLAAGLVLGLGIVLLLEFRDTAVRSERDIWAFLDLPVLTSISLSEDVPSEEGSRGWFGRIFLQRVKRTNVAAPAKA